MYHFVVFPGSLSVPVGGYFPCIISLFSQAHCQCQLVAIFHVSFRCFSRLTVSASRWLFSMYHFVVFQADGQYQLLAIFYVSFRRFLGTLSVPVAGYFRPESRVR